MGFSSLKSWFADSKNDGWVIRRVVVDYGYGQGKAYAFALGLGAVVSACIAGTAFIVGTVVNQAYVDRNFHAIAGLAVIIVAVFLIKGLAMYGSNVTMARIGFRVVAGIQRQLFDKLMIEGIAYFSAKHSTQILAKTTRGARAASELLKMVVNSLGRDLLTLIALAAVMIVQDPLMSAFAFIIMPPAFFLIRGLIRRTREIARQEQGGALKVFEAIQEAIRGFAVVKAFTLEDTMRERVYSHIQKVEGKQYKLARIANRSSPIMESLGGISIAIVLLYGAYRVIELGATPGEFVSFITAFLLAYEPAKRLARLHIDLTRKLIAVRAILEILDSPAQEHEQIPAGDIVIQKGEIAFRDVEFAYKEKEPVLRGISFTAAPGKMTALVGHSGGGKSTVVSLILRFYDPKSGSIEIDGIDIRQYSRRSLRRQIAYVGQDIFLFNGTIGENIGFGKLGASQEEIVEAAKAAFAHDFIVSFEDGYETEVGESGARLSSGQRQRIAVARAFIRRAPIILLDEATSALDGKAEREVQMAIERLREGRTCVAIAHRLHTIMHASQICVIEHGRILESGTHGELMRKKGFYAEMFRVQLEDEPDDNSAAPMPASAAG